MASSSTPAGKVLRRGIGVAVITNRYGHPVVHRFVHRVNRYGHPVPVRIADLREAGGHGR